VKRLFLIGLSFAVVALAAPGAAQAAEPFTPELEADYTAALAWWGISSPPQCATVVREILPTNPFPEKREDAAMVATQPEPGKTQVFCQIVVFEDIYRATKTTFPVTAGCIIEHEMRHEVGHLTGLGHSDDPNDVMYKGNNFPTICAEEMAESVPESNWREELKAELAKENERLERSRRRARRHRLQCRHLSVGRPSRGFSLGCSRSV
jgi:hypothetical protein